jgi:hypothetical protein
MSGPRSKRPFAATIPAPTKTPYAEGLPDLPNMKPVWRLSRLDFDGPFGWASIEGMKLREVVVKLRQFESMTWNEIERANKQHHFNSAENFSKEAKERMNTLQMDDLDQMFSFRLMGTERIYGYRDRWIFYPIWWDPDHKVYPVEKRNT